MDKPSVYPEIAHQTIERVHGLVVKPPLFGGSGAGESRLFSQITNLPHFSKQNARNRESCPLVNSEPSRRKSGVIGSVFVKQGAYWVISFRGAETHTRSVLKAVSWRTLGTLDTFAISWFMTGRVEIAGSIAGLEVATKIAWYYAHERVWATITWGRRREAS